MPDFSLSDMPWLLQTADAGGSLARGASAGAAIANARAQRQSLAQRRMEFEQQQQMAQREMTINEKIAPLREKALSMALEKDSLELNELQRQLNLRESNAKSYDELANFITASVQAGKAATPDVTLGVVSILSRNPTLLEDQRAQSLMKYFNGAVQLGLERQKLESLSVYRDLGLDLRERDVARKEAEAIASTARKEDLTKIAEKNVELREREAEARQRELEARLDPISRAGLEAEIKAIHEDVRLFSQPAEKKKQIDAVLEKYRSGVSKAPSAPKSFDYIPGKGLVPK